MGTFSLLFFFLGYTPTVKKQFKKSVIVDGDYYELKIVDSCGQDECVRFTEIFGFNSDGFMLVYSINDRKSFEVLSPIREAILEMSSPEIPIVLIGNKCDLEVLCEFLRCFEAFNFVSKFQQERMVSWEEGRKLATKWNANFLEATAINNEQSILSFELLLRSIERKSRLRDELQRRHWGQQRNCSESEAIVPFSFQKHLSGCIIS